VYYGPDRAYLRAGRPKPPIPRFSELPRTHGLLGRDHGLHCTVGAFTFSPDTGL
jgi:hypothetical protein